MSVPAIKPVLSAAQQAAAEVGAAVSPDQAREHLCKPWGQLMQGRGFICGTDGHRLHAVECETWEECKRTDTNPPPADSVIPWNAVYLGEIVAAGLDDLRCFTSRWDVALEVQPQANFLHVSVSTGSGKKSKRLRPFGMNGVRVEYLKLEQLTFSFGIQLEYLLDAVDFIGCGVVKLWAEPAKNKNHVGLTPLAFTAPGVKSIVEARRIAVVMPRRV